MRSARSARRRVTGLCVLRLGLAAVQCGQGFCRLFDGLHTGGQCGGHCVIGHLCQFWQLDNLVAHGRLQLGPPLRPCVGLCLCGVSLGLLPGDGLGQKLHLRLGVLPAFPFSVPRHEPRRGVGGQAVTGLVQRRLQICLQRRGFCLGGADVVQQRGVAGLCGLGGLLQQIELVLGRLPCLGALVEGGLCPLHVLLTRLGGL